MMMRTTTAALFRSASRVNNRRLSTIVGTGANSTRPSPMSRAMTDFMSTGSRFFSSAPNPDDNRNVDYEKSDLIHPQESSTPNLDETLSSAMSTVQSGVDTVSGVYQKVMEIDAVKNTADTMGGVTDDLVVKGLSKVEDGSKIASEKFEEYKDRAVEVAKEKVPEYKEKAVDAAAAGLDKLKETMMKTKETAEDKAGDVLEEVSEKAEEAKHKAMDAKDAAMEKAKKASS